MSSLSSTSAPSNPPSSGVLGSDFTPFGVTWMSTPFIGGVPATLFGIHVLSEVSTLKKDGILTAIKRLGKEPKEESKELDLLKQKATLEAKKNRIIHDINTLALCNLTRQGLTTAVCATAAVTNPLWLLPTAIYALSTRDAVKTCQETSVESQKTQEKDNQLSEQVAQKIAEKLVPVEDGWLLVDDSQEEGTR